MGQLTRDQIVAAALLQGGMASSLSTRAEKPFNAALRSLYKAWSWPFLKKRATGISLPTGTQALTLGAGSGGITLEIQEFFDPLYVYTSDRGTKQTCYIQQLVKNPNVSMDETLNDSSTFRGLPTRCKIRASTLWGRWDFIPLPFPEKDYLLAFDYLEQPADISSGSSVPIYPNDRTLIRVVMAEMLLDQHGIASKQYQAAAEEAGAMVVHDRQRYGQHTGDNDNIGLDTSVFK
jgi:hypothetical protein